MLAHLQLAGGDVAAVLADEVRVLQVHQQARLEPRHVVALWALVQPYVEVYGVDVIPELSFEERHKIIQDLFNFAMLAIHINYWIHGHFSKAERCVTSRRSI